MKIEELSGSFYARSSVYVLIGQLLYFLIQFVSVIILVSLLSPTDFGLVAMLGIFFALALILRDGGLTALGLQYPKLSEYQSSNLFWINSLYGLIFGFIFLALTPFFVFIYGDPKLETISPFFAFSLFITGIQAQIQIDLARRKKYLLLTLSNLFALLISVFISVLLALNDFGYWALVMQQFSYFLLLLAIRSFYSEIKLNLPKRHVGTKKLILGSTHIGGAQLLDWSSKNIAPVLVGVSQGATSLGIYDRAFQLSVVPVQSLLHQFTQIVIPHSKYGDVSREILLKLLSDLQKIIFLLFGFILGLLFILSPSLVLLDLSSEWYELIPVIQVLVFASLFLTLSFPTFWIFAIGNYTKEQLKYSATTRPITLLLTVIGAFFGPLGIALGIMASFLLNWIIGTIWVQTRLGFDTKKLIKTSTVYLLLFTFSTITVYLGQQIIPKDLVVSGWSSFWGILCFSTIYSFLILFTKEGRSSIKTLMNLIKKIF